MTMELTVQHSVDHDKSVSGGFRTVGAVEIPD